MMHKRDYTGVKEKDAESGLYYYGARYYAAWTCRFISIDPLASKYPNLSGYLYAYNNPIMMNDPTGMEGEEGGGNVPVTTQVSENVTIQNVHAKKVEENIEKIDNLKDEISGFEKKIEGLTVESEEYKTTQNEIQKANKQIKNLEKSNETEKVLATKINDAINDFFKKSENFVHTNKGGKGAGRNMANKFGYTAGEPFNYSNTLQSALNKEAPGKDLLIRVGTGETDYVKGIQADGQTRRTFEHESLDIYRITIKPNVIDMDIVLANEMGDVLYDYEKKGLRISENKIVQEDKTVHNNLYNNNKLDSKAYSGYIEQMYRNSIGRR